MLTWRFRKLSGDTRSSIVGSLPGCWTCCAPGENRSSELSGPTRPRTGRTPHPLAPLAPLTPSHPSHPSPPRTPTPCAPLTPAQPGHASQAGVSPSADPRAPARVSGRPSAEPLVWRWVVRSHSIGMVAAIPRSRLRAQLRAAAEAAVMTAAAISDSATSPESCAAQKSGPPRSAADVRDSTYSANYRPDFTQARRPRRDGGTTIAGSRSFRARPGGCRRTFCPSRWSRSRSRSGYRLRHGLPGRAGMPHRRTRPALRRWGWLVRLTTIASPLHMSTP